MQFFLLIRKTNIHHFVTESDMTYKGFLQAFYRKHHSCPHANFQFSAKYLSNCLNNNRLQRVTKSWECCQLQDCQ